MIDSPPVQGIASQLNSTVATLAGGATFTGVGEANNYPHAFVMSKSDVAGTLFLDFSVDGTNWDSTYPSSGYECAAAIPEVHVAKKASRWFRIRYVNGADAQSYLRLGVYYGQYGELAAALNQNIGLDSDATVVRPTSAQDEITIGRRVGVTPWNNFGYRSDIDTADGDALIIADNVTNTPTILTTASTFDIAYDGTAGGSTDGAGTTGAIELTFFYLNASGSETTTAHTLGTDGTDTTSFSGLGINRVLVTVSGSNDANVSDITITATTGGSLQACIIAGESITQQAWFHTPTDEKGCAKYLFIGANKLSGSSPLVTFKGIVHSRTNDTKYEIFRHVMDTGTENSFIIQDPVNFGLESGDVLYFTAATTANNTAVECRFSINTYQNS